MPSNLPNIFTRSITGLLHKLHLLTRPISHYRHFSDILNDLFLLDGPERYRAIEGLRALAIFMVFNVHAIGQFQAQKYFTGDNNYLYQFFWFFQKQISGVDLFFVISGFLIYKTVRKTDVVKFAIKRVLRLLPAHLFVTFAVLITTHATFNRFFLTVFFLPALINNPGLTLNYPTWSLGWEMLFYIAIFPIGKLAFRFQKPWQRIGVLLGTASIISLALVLLKKNYPILAGIPDPERFMNFFIGVLIAEMVSVDSLKLFFSKIPVLPLVIALGLMVSLWNMDYFSPTSYFPIVGLIGGLILFSVLCRKSWFEKVMSTQALRIVGQSSYSIYLFHAGLVLPMIYRFFVPVNFNQMIIFYLVGLVLSVACGMGSFILFERPYFLYFKKEHLKEKITSPLPS